MNDKLLPCPFCGGQAIIEQYKRDGLYLKCTACLIGIKQRTLRNSLEWLEETLIHDWNKRKIELTTSEAAFAANGLDYLKSLESYKRKAQRLSVIIGKLQAVIAAEEEETVNE